MRNTDTTAATASRYRAITLIGYYGTEHDFPSLKAAAAWLRISPMALHNALKRRGRVGGFVVRYTDELKAEKAEKK